jgi:hypothetical protein
MSGDGKATNMYSYSYERSFKTCNAQRLCCKHFKGVPKTLLLLKEKNVFINVMVKQCFSHTELLVI